MILPVCVKAQVYYTAIQKDARTSVATITDSRLYVDPSIISPVVKATAFDKPYSLGVWVNIDSYMTQAGAGSYTNPENSMVIMGYGGRAHCNNNGCWNLVVDKNGVPGFSGWGNKISGDKAFDGTTVPLNQWVHMMVVYNPETPSLSFYMDGALVGEKTMTAQHEWFTDETPAIYFASYGFSKYIDEVAIYNKALTATEVVSAKTYAPAVSGLLGLYHFAEVAEGTTAQYANESTQDCASSLKMTYVKSAASGTNNAWANGLAYVTDTEEAPTTTADASIARQAPDIDATVTLEQSEGGTIAITNTADGTEFSDGENAVKVGNALTITATPEDGYQLIGIYAMDTETGTTTEITGDTYVVTGNVIITARFTNETYALTILNEQNFPFTITLNGQEVTDYEHMLGGGAEYHLTVTEPEDKVFTSITINGVSQAPAEGGYYAIVLDGDATLAINGYAKPTFTVTFEQPTGGTVGATTGSGTSMVTLNSGDSVLQGTEITLTNTKNAGYIFVNYVVNGSNYSGTTYTVNENVTISAVFEEGLDYCEPTGTSDAARYVNTLNVSDDQGNSITVNPNGQTNKTFTLLDDVFVTAPGATVTLTVPSNGGDGTWQHSYFFIDYGRDGTFDVDNTINRANGDLVSFNFYNSNLTGSTGYNSKGASANYNQSVVGTLPTFTLPSDMAPGKYRVRYRLFWNNVDPCADLTSAGTETGKQCFDFYFQIPNSELDTPRTVTVTANDAALGTVAITDPATDESSIETTQARVTVKATAADGAVFINWTDADGNELSTNSTYAYDGTEDATLTANFGFAVTFSSNSDGSLAVSANGESLTSGAVVLPGTEITITATPATDKVLINLAINGEVQTVTDGTLTYTVNSATEITATFGSEQHTLHILVSGNGTLEAWTELDSNDGPAGTQYTDGAGISKDIELIVFLTPDAGEELSSFTVDDNGNVTDATQDAKDFTNENGQHISFVSYPEGDVTLSAVFTVEGSAIDSVISDADANAPAEFYNLQGVKVGASNLAPGVYVVRQGSKTYKVLVK